MKQLSQAEFEALPSDRPIDSRVDGLPLEEFYKALVWVNGEWTLLMLFQFGTQGRFIWGGQYFVDKYPIYHKLPQPVINGD